MRGIGVHSGMPDHQILETCQFTRRLQNFDFTIFGLDFCESLGCGQNQFGSWNAACSRAEIGQRNHGSTAVAVCCETLLRYMLRTLDDVDANVFGREVLLQSELTLVGSICRNNADELFLVNDLGE